ncbi:MAG: hypothetical protein KDN05_24935, partial [Verrucomicrobiae bacterium]|nr:hypothetical protein [Verrucomicrobiae bacterium]
MLVNQPVIDSQELAFENQRVLGISRTRAAELGESAVAISEAGSYTNPMGKQVFLRFALEEAMQRRASI